MKTRSKKLRLLITSDTVGGVWNYSLDLIRELGAECTIYLASQGPVPSAQHARELQSMPSVRWAHRQYALEWMENAWSDLDEAGEWLLNCQNEFTPDIVHLNSFSYASLPWRAPTVLVAHSCSATWWRAVKGEPAPKRFDEYRSRVQAGLNDADLIVFPTSAFRDAMMEAYEIPILSKVIWNGRTSHFYRPGKKLPQVFSAGRLWDESKNTVLLNRIAPRLKWPVVVCGPSQSPDQTEHFYPHLHTLGILSEQEVAARLKTASIYVAPATYEPFGLAILEAAMSGCALVLADIPTLRELWHDAAIFLSPQDDVQWIETINHLADSPHLRKELADKALMRSKHYTTEQLVSKYREVYAKLASSSENRALAQGAL